MAPLCLDHLNKVGRILNRVPRKLGLEEIYRG
jgi:hypothetical protein